MLFGAISEEKIRVSRSLSFYCRNYRVKRKEKRGFFAVNFGKFLTFKEKLLNFSKAKKS